MHRHFLPGWRSHHKQSRRTFLLGLPTCSSCSRIILLRLELPPVRSCGKPRTASRSASFQHRSASPVYYDDLRPNYDVSAPIVNRVGSSYQRHPFVVTSVHKPLFRLSIVATSGHLRTRVGLVADTCLTSLALLHKGQRLCRIHTRARGPTCREPPHSE